MAKVSSPWIHDKSSGFIHVEETEIFYIIFLARWEKFFKKSRKIDIWIFAPKIHNCLNLK